MTMQCKLVEDIVELRVVPDGAATGMSGERVSSYKDVICDKRHLCGDSYDSVGCLARQVRMYINRGR